MHLPWWEVWDAFLSGSWARGLGAGFELDRCMLHGFSRSRAIGLGAAD